jgi:hypothetical protein
LCQLLNNTLSNFHFVIFVHLFQGRRVSVRYWSTCSVPYTIAEEEEEVNVEKCLNYRTDSDLIQIDTFQNTLADTVQECLS